MTFVDRIRILLKGTEWRFEENATLGTIRITCNRHFRDSISKLAWYHLSMGIGLYVNGEWIPYYQEGMKRMEEEKVNHPSHYGGADNPYEVIKVMEAWLTKEEFVGAMKFQVFKYTARARLKNNAEDHAKSAWYDNYLTDYLRRKSDKT